MPFSVILDLAYMFLNTRDRGDKYMSHPAAIFGLRPGKCCSRNFENKLKIFCYFVKWTEEFLMQQDTNVHPKRGKCCPMTFSCLWKTASYLYLVKVDQNKLLTRGRLLLAVSFRPKQTFVAWFPLCATVAAVVKLVACWTKRCMLLLLACLMSWVSHAVCFYSLNVVNG